MLPSLGLKGSSSMTQINDRLAYHPNTYEFFTQASDFTSAGFLHLKEAVAYVKQAGVAHIVLHHPMQFHEFHTELVAPADRYPDLYQFVEESSQMLIQLAKEQDVQCLIHGSYAHETQQFIDCYSSLAAARHAAFERMDRFAKLGGDHVMFENSISPIFAYGDPEVESQILRHHYRLAFDTSHCFIYLHGNNKGLQASLLHLQPLIVHYHLVDSMGKVHDSLPLGQGKIDWRAVLKCLNPRATSIYEINLQDNNHCVEQVESHRYLQRLCKGN